jgi:Uma2 family endonuclease
VIPKVDVDLQLVPRDQPATVRRPDFVVVTRAGLERVRREGRFLRAMDAVLAVEIIPPGSRRLDTVVKAAEYADTGIPHYWIVDREAAVTLTAHHLVGAFGYAADAPVGGVFVAEEPFPVRLELDRLG